MNKVFMFMLAVVMTGSVYADMWDGANGVNSEKYKETLSAPTAVGSSDADLHQELQFLWTEISELKKQMTKDAD